MMQDEKLSTSDVPDESLTVMQAPFIMNQGAGLFYAGQPSPSVNVWSRMCNESVISVWLDWSLLNVILAN